jgi:hypothetical protein
LGAIEAEAERGRIGQWDSIRDEVAEYLAAISGRELREAIADGRALTLEQAVQFALPGA